MTSIKRHSNILVALHVKSIFILKLNCDNIGTTIKVVTHLLVPIVEVGFHWSVILLVENSGLNWYENPLQKIFVIGMGTKKMVTKNDHLE